jgi:hypothetical protein
MWRTVGSGAGVVHALRGGGAHAPRGDSPVAFAGNRIGGGDRDLPGSANRGVGIADGLGQLGGERGYENGDNARGGGNTHDAKRSHEPGDRLPGRTRHERPRHDGRARDGEWRFDHGRPENRGGQRPDDHEHRPSGDAHWHGNREHPHDKHREGERNGEKTQPAGKADSGV